MNIDGLPLFKSSNTQFWPILGRTIHPAVSKPFAIGIFLGNGKPKNYLCDLIDHINNLTATGLLIPHTGQHIQIKVSCVICDSPARAFVKQSKGHSGHFGCDKCVQKGLYPSKHPTLYDVIIWLVLGWLVNNQKPTLVQRHHLIRIQRYNLTLTQRYLISDWNYI